MVSKDEFEEWRRNPVTKELFKYVEDTLDSAKETLATDAGMNPLADRDLVGGISALREIIEWIPEFSDSGAS